MLTATARRACCQRPALSARAALWRGRGLRGRPGSTTWASRSASGSAGHHLPARAPKPGLGARAGRLGEGGPVVGREDQLGAFGVLRVTYRDRGQRAGHLDAVTAVVAAVGRLAPHLGNLDAVTAVPCAVAGLAPYGAGQVHVLATSCKSSSEAARGRASVFSVS